MGIFLAIKLALTSPKINPPPPPTTIHAEPRPRGKSPHRGTGRRN